MTRMRSGGRKGGNRVSWRKANRGAAAAVIYAAITSGGIGVKVLRWRKQKGALSLIPDEA